MKAAKHEKPIVSGSLIDGIIFRTDLTQKLKEKSAKKNIFITAPGGYGKTVAAMQLLSSVRGAAVRLTAGNADNDPDIFYRRLAAVVLRLAGKEKDIPETGRTLDSLLEILALMPKKSARCYLALDDMHILKNEEIQGSLPLVVKRLPSYICLCVISRAEPSAPLLETGRFEVFTKDDLLFTPKEIEWMCEEKELSHTPELIGDILETTGGWAMYLSAVLSGDKEPNISEKDKAPQTLMQYLDTHVWELWDDETRNLLMRLSVPAQITPELCERLTGHIDGRGILERLTKKENAFLSGEGDDIYRFHDIFRDFLLERIGKYLGKDEFARLNDIAAGWYYENGDYFAGTRHYIQNKDHEGVSRCMGATNRFHEKSGSLSVEVSLNFTRQYVMSLPSEFIAENPYLISECAVVAFHNGDAGEFLHYTDMLYERLPEIASEYPDLTESVGFIGGLDFRVPLTECARTVAEMMPMMPEDAAMGDEAHSNTITQNLPFFHRSMRDFSEYHDLQASEMKLLRDTFGVMIGNDYTVMEQSLIAGIYYERGNLIEAVRHALNGYNICDEAMQPETIFSAYMILAAVLFAMGASRDANRVMEQAGTYLDSKATFLRPNFKALQARRALRAGNTDAAREWLTVYASRTGHLPFYQICRHFTTLRSYIAIKNYAAAVAFGTRLYTLAEEYNRPLDKIESGLLTSIAYWLDGHYDKAGKLMGQAVEIAIPYGFTQIFINEGKEILPLLWALRENRKKSVKFMRFVDGLTDEIYIEHDFESLKERPPSFSAQQRTMLSYLSKGLTYSEIADELGLARGTVKTHVLLVYKRLGVHSMPEALLKAKMLGILE